MPFDPTLLLPEETSSGFDPSLLIAEEQTDSNAPTPDQEAAQQEILSRPAIPAWDQSDTGTLRAPTAWETFRHGPIGTKVLGAPVVERAPDSRLGPAGGEFGIVPVAEKMLQFTSVPPQLSEPIKRVTDPLVEMLPDVPQGIVKGGRELALTTPLAPFGKAGTAALGLFGGEYVAALPERKKAYREALARGDKTEAAKIATETVLGGALLGAGTYHAAKGKPSTTGEQNAIQSETETAVRDVSAQPGESAGEVPVESAVPKDVARGGEKASQEGVSEVQRHVATLNDEAIAPADKVKAGIRLAETVSKMSPDEFVKMPPFTRMVEKISEAIDRANDPSALAKLKDLHKQAIDRTQQEFLDAVKKSQDMPPGPERDAVLDVTAKLASYPQFFNEAVQKAEWLMSNGEKNADKFTENLPFYKFQGEVPENHIPIRVKTKNGLEYDAYLSAFEPSQFAPGGVLRSVGKIKRSGAYNDPSLSHGILGKDETIIKGPKTAEEYKAAVEAKAKARPASTETSPQYLRPSVTGDQSSNARGEAENVPRGTTGETQPATAGEAVPAVNPEAAPAYTKGVAVPSGVPGLLIDPFGFQAAKIVGRAIKDVYDSPIAKKLRKQSADLWNAAAMKSAPLITGSNRQTGEAAVRYASSYFVGRTKGQIFADKVLFDTGVDPIKFGTALTEDNLRSVRAGLPPEQAANTRTLIGTRGSPFATEAEYQAFLNDPQTQIALDRHKQLWTEQKDPLFRQANDLDPDVTLATRGLQTGARINLKALRPDEPGTKPIGRPPGFRQLATLKRRDPFGKKATGAGQAYEGHYHEIMANGFEKELPVAAQHEFIRQLIESGDAKVSDKITDPDMELKGEGTKGYLMSLKPWKGKFLHVREGLAGEYEAISGLDKPLKIPLLTTVNNFFTRQSVAGLAEGSTHASNLMTQIFTGLGPTSNPLLNGLIKSLGRVDLLYQIPRVMIKAFTNQRERMLELAEMGAAKEPYPGAVSKRLLNPVDQGVRLVTDDIYKGMAAKGWVENNETARREFINQVGQYNKRLQPLLIRRLRESGIQPFATAAETFNIQGLRRLVGAPGVKATSNARALALRADVAGGWIGAIALITGLNLLLSKKATGPAGTPLGAVAWVGDDKKVHNINVLRLIGFERGLRITGIGPAIDAKRLGLSNQQAVGAAVKAQTGAALGMVMGPGPRFATITGTGLRPTDPTQREVPRVPPTDSMNPLKTQLAKNIQVAVTEMNPLISSGAEIKKGIEEGKPAGEIITKTTEKQLSRYTPRTGMTEQTATALPKIVDSRQLRDYTEDVAKDARKLPLRERNRYVRKRFTDDGLARKYQDKALQHIQRQGVFTYGLKGGGTPPAPVPEGTFDPSLLVPE